MHAQSYPTLCDAMNCNPPGSSVQGNSQARILEWVAIPFSRGSSLLRLSLHLLHLLRCRWILYWWAIREAHKWVLGSYYLFYNRWCVYFWLNTCLALFYRYFQHNFGATDLAHSIYRQYPLSNLIEKVNPNYQQNQTNFFGRQKMFNLLFSI